MDENYKVGYGKPSKHSQFKPKQSGNPSGRPKGARGLKADLVAELSSKHTIHINKEPVRGTKQRLMIWTLATRAASGDVKAAQILLPIIMQSLGVEDRSTDKRELSAQDQQILDDLLNEPDRNDLSPKDKKNDSPSYDGTSDD